jgi:hypothetical protein
MHVALVAIVRCVSLRAGLPLGSSARDISLECTMAELQASAVFATRNPQQFRRWKLGK